MSINQIKLSKTVTYERKMDSSSWKRKRLARRREKFVGKDRQRTVTLLPKLHNDWVVDVSQLVEQSLLTPEICGSNPVISKFYLLPTVLKRQKYIKEASKWPPFKDTWRHIIDKMLGPIVSTTNDFSDELFFSHGWVDTFI